MVTPTDDIVTIKNNVFTVVCKLRGDISDIFLIP